MPVLVRLPYRFRLREACGGLVRTDILTPPTRTGCPAYQLIRIIYLFVAGNRGIH
jgi:hypothetical protein